ETVKQRNYEILNEHFGTMLTDIRIWPISNTSLMKYVQTKKKAYLEDSQYAQLAAALRVFLFRVAGWDFSAKALERAKQYYDVGHQTLSVRLKRIEEMPAEKHAELEPLLIQKKQQFDEEWGPFGQKWRELQVAIGEIAATNKESVLRALRPRA